MADQRQLIRNVRWPRILYGLLFWGIVPFLFWSKLKHHGYFYSFYKSTLKNKSLSITKNYFSENPVKYAVFCSSTPNGQSYRGYDYAFYLPLTALAWERIGFKSLVLIIGSKCEWENDPALIYILHHLKARHVKMIFVNSPLQYRTTISQAARAFAVNMLEFPGKDKDYLITSDADLWPLRKEHYIPEEHAKIVLLHADCCGQFKTNNYTYSMYPMSNIGATVSTWRQIMNENHIIANDSASILDYLENLFGSNVRSPIVVGTESWYRDQRMVSIRLTEWMNKYGNQTVQRVSDEGFYRIDRSEWYADKLVLGNFTLQYDAHLPVKGFLAAQSKRIKPLINLMYGEKSWEAKWYKSYTENFLLNVKNYLKLKDINETSLIN